MATQQRQYTVVYEEIEDGWIMARVPELPGAVTQGKNREEAREMIKEAVELLLASYQANAASTAAASAIWDTVTVDVPTS
jgi:predicted RNase H-like HicB family nuclease